MKTDPFLKFLSYFWGPIPWMIEGAVIITAALFRGDPTFDPLHKRTEATAHHLKVFFGRHFDIASFRVEL